MSTNPDFNPKQRDVFASLRTLPSSYDIKHGMFCNFCAL